jgi:hypothetical protein
LSLFEDQGSKSKWQGRRRIENLERIRIEKKGPEKCVEIEHESQSTFSLSSLTGVNHEAIDGKCVLHLSKEAKKGQGNRGSIMDGGSDDHCHFKQT